MSAPDERPAEPAWPSAAAEPAWSSVGPAPVPGASPEDEPRWGPWTWLVGLGVALAGTAVLVVMLAIVLGIAGLENIEDAAGFGLAAGALQELAFVAAAIGVTAELARPSGHLFGFRSFRPSALGWALLALVTYFVLAALYVELAHPPPDDLPQQLGADESTALAIATGVFVIGVAPVVEELFFRGFLYQALRSRVGVIGAAVASGFVFGLIHLEPEFLAPLTMLGIVLALLFQKTSSLWPCILVHALNNSIAFAVTL